MNGNHQMVPVDYFFNNDLMYLQGGISTITYTTSTTKTKAAQYDLQGVEDMILNIWSHVKVSYDKYALWGISNWRQQRKTSMRMHEAWNPVMMCDFPRLRINDIEDMLILIVQNKLTNLSSDYVSDFAIALRMFTRSMVIQKRVEDLQLGVESYQKKINFSDGTLTRLRSSLDDITKNIRMKYLPKRRWSSLEKKRAHIMIKGIDKQLKERRMMRILEKFVGRRHYRTDLRLL
ncbi:hypothetical protein Tco_0758380 [Tanacetum coccineum]